MGRQIWNFGVAFFVMLCWGIGYIWYKMSYLSFGVFTVVITKFLLGALVLTVLMKIKGIKAKYTKLKFKQLLLLVFCDPFLFFLGEGFALKYVSATLTCIIIATIPLFTPLMGKLVFGYPVKKGVFLGLSFSFVGVIFTVMSSDLGSGSFLGFALLFLAVVSSLFYVMILQKLSADFPVMQLVRDQFLIASIYFLPLFLIFELPNFSQLQIVPTAVEGIVFLVIFETILGFLGYNYLIKEMGAVATNSFLNLMPVVTMIGSYFMLGESITWQKILGIFLVLAGLFIVQLPKILGEKSRIRFLFPE